MCKRNNAKNVKNIILEFEHHTEHLFYFSSTGDLVGGTKFGITHKFF